MKNSKPLTDTKGNKADLLLEVRALITKLLSEYANTPLNKRENGWYWLSKLDDEIAELL